MTYSNKERSVSGLDKDKDKIVCVFKSNGSSSELGDLILSELFHPTHLEYVMSDSGRSLVYDGRSVKRGVDKNGEITKIQSPASKRTKKD